MPIATGEESLQVQYLYWAAAIVAVMGAGLWRSANLRSKVQEEWSDRVDIIRAGLSDSAVGVLTELRRRIDELLGREGNLPLAATAEPAQLLVLVRRLEKLIKAQNVVRKRFRWLLRVGNVFVLALLATIIGVVIVALDTSNLYSVVYQLQVGGALISFGVFLLLTCFLIYWYLLHAIGKAETLSRTDDE